MIDESTGRPFFWNGTQLFVDDSQRPDVEAVLKNCETQGIWSEVTTPTAFGSPTTSDLFLCWSLDIPNDEITKVKAALDATPRLYLR